MFGPEETVTPSGQAALSRSFLSDSRGRSLLYVPPNSLRKIFLSSQHLCGHEINKSMKLTQGEKQKAKTKYGDIVGGGGADRERVC